MDGGLLYGLLSTGFIQASIFDGAAWSPAQNVSLASGTNSLLQPVVTTFTNGTALAIWFNIVAHRLESAFYNGTTWTQRLVITSGTTINPQLATLPNGTAIAIWQNNSEGAIQGAIYDGLGWIHLTNISTVGQSVNKPNLAVNALGEAVAVWLNVALGTVQGAVFQGVEWTRTGDVSPAPGSYDDPHVALSDTGYAVAVFTNTAATSIQSAVLSTIPTPPNPPTNLMGTVLADKFLFQTEIVHRLTFTPSTSSVDDYLVYRNGFPVATISGTGPFVFVDRNRGQHVDFYEVIAVSGGVESEAATITIPTSG